jgi:hypothetical protein
MIPTFLDCAKKVVLHAENKYKMDRKIGTSPNGTLSPVGSEGAGKGRRDLCWPTKIALDSSPLPIRVYLALWGEGKQNNSSFVEGC